jgi:hypothetical protein
MVEGMEYVNAFFTDDKRKTVRSYWSSNGGSELVEYILEADENDSGWQKLMECVTIDEIHDNTWSYIKDSEDAFKESVVQIAKERGYLVNMDDGGTSDFHKIVVDLIFDPHDEVVHKEKLFFFKMQLFEREFMKQCTDKALKKELRKAPSVLEAVKVAIEIFETSAASDA